MAEPHPNQAEPGQHFVHQGELDVAQSTGSQEWSDATGEGYERAEKPPVIDHERLQSIHNGVLERADRLFSDVARALNQPGMDETPELVIDKVLSEGDAMERWTEWYIRQAERKEGRPVTKDEADLAYIKLMADNAAENKASDVKHAGVSAEQYRRHQNKEAGTARERAADKAEGPVMSRRLNEYFGDTLEELSRRLRDKREAESTDQKAA